MEKRPDIQGIRGYAITMVVLYHFFQKYFPNGYIGVDAFFVVSGFLIAMVLERNEKITASVILIFYYKRVRRIVPLYYFVIVGAQISLLSVLPDSYNYLNRESCWEAMTFTSNIRMRGVEQEYERKLTIAKDLFTHTWSLSVEMQWYLLVPLLFLVARSIIKWKKVFFIGILLCSFAFYSYTDETTAFNNVLARAWQFSCGVIAFFAQEHKISSATERDYECVEQEEEEEQEKTDGSEHHIGYMFASYILFLFAIALSLTWIPYPKNCLRITTTMVFAILIFVGSSHQLFLLSNRLTIYVGDISYALYLIHWPVYVVINSFSWQPLYEHLAIVTGSVVLTIAVHHLFECQYQEWSPHFVSVTVLVLLATSATMFHELDSKLDQEEMKELDFNLTSINISESAWNMTDLSEFGTPSMQSTAKVLMNCDPIAVSERDPVASNSRVLRLGPVALKVQIFEAARTNCDEFRRRVSIIAHIALMRDLLRAKNARDLSIGHFCIKAFEFRRGLEDGRCCSMTNGTGLHKIMVVGNSFACNQGDLVYNAFRNHTSDFLIFSFPGCELMTANTYCVHNKYDYTEVLQKVKPDIVFVLSRYFAAKEEFNTTRPISEDKIFSNFMKHMNELEHFAKKVYLLQALPSCLDMCNLDALFFTRNGRPLRDIKDKLIIRDEFYARERISEVGKRCKKCEIIDYYSLLLDEDGQYLGYNPRTNVMYLDGANHFTIFGKERIQKLFVHLASKIEKEI